MAQEFECEYQKAEKNAVIIKEPKRPDLGHFRWLPAVLLVQLRVFSDLPETIADVDIQQFKKRRDSVVLDSIPNRSDHIAEVECLEPVPVSVDAGLEEVAISKRVSNSNGKEKLKQDFKISIYYDFHKSFRNYSAIVN